MAGGHNDIVDNDAGDETSNLFYWDPVGTTPEDIHLSGNFWGMDRNSFNFERFYPAANLVFKSIDEQSNVIQSNDFRRLSRQGYNERNRVLAAPAGATTELAIGKQLLPPPVENASGKGSIRALKHTSYTRIDSLYGELEQRLEEFMQGQNFTFPGKRSEEIETVMAFLAFRDQILEQILNPAPLEKMVAAVPQEFELFQNYPNPFNPATTIRYRLPRVAQVRLEIYNVLGQKIKTLVDERQEATSYTVEWDGANAAGLQVAAGMYVYRLVAQTESGDNIAITKKMMLVK
jgi:hypothetical protein